MTYAIRFATLAFGLGLFICAITAYAQSPSASNVWFVLERINPAPVSRIDWVSVGNVDAQRDGWVIVPRAATSFATALALADVHRLGDRFKTVCDHSFHVYRDPRTRLRSVSKDPVGGQILERTGLCCESAFEFAFPTPPGTAPATPDCRTLNLMSVAGTVRLTPAGWLSTSGIPITIPTVPPIVIPSMSAPPPRGSCKTVQKINQPESRDAAGKIKVEAATIHVMNCPGQGQIYIYQYRSRAGFRAVRPPIWSAIGGRDFPTFEQAEQAAVSGAGPVIDPPVQDKYSVYVGTWNGVGNAKGITMTIKSDRTMTFIDTRPAYARSDNNGRWGPDPNSNSNGISTALGYGLYYRNGVLVDPWNNIYTK